MKAIMLDQNELALFKQILKDDYKIELSDEQAQVLAAQLIGLTRVIYQIP